MSSSYRHADTIAQATILNEIGWEYRLSYPDSTISYCQRAIDMSRNTHEKARSLNFMGIAYMYKGNYGQAFRYHREALDFARQTGDSSQMAHAYNNLGRLFFTQGDMIKSYDYFINALHTFEEIHDSAGIGYCYQSLMQLYKLQNDKEKTLEMLQKALAIRQKSGNTRGQISTLKELAMFYEKEQDFEQAQKYLRQAKALGDSVDDKISTAEVDLALASLYLNQKNYAQAMDHSRKALVAAGISNNQTLLTSAYLILARIYYAQQAYNQSKLYLHKVIAFSRNTGDLPNRKESYYYLSRIYEKARDYKHALAYHQQYLSVKDSLYNTDNARTIERLENRLEIEEKEQEYELLKAAEARNQMIIRQQKIKNIAKSMIIGLVLILLLALSYFYYRIRKKNKLLIKHQDKIENQNREISQQNKKIQQQYGVLRKHNEKLADLDKEKDTLMGIVAHDLKAPFNRIVTLSDLLIMDRLTPEEKKKYTYLIKETSKDGITLIRDLLDASAFEHYTEIHYREVALNSFLNELSQNYQAQAAAKSIQVHLSLPEDLHLETDEIYLTRILDNLVSNAIKYSRPESNIYLKAYSSLDKHILISVKDEGPGFSEEDRKYLYQKFRKLSARPTQGESSHGLGLAIVKTLVTRLGGKIELHSEPRKGSEFIITFPAYQEEAVR